MLALMRLLRLQPCAFQCRCGKDFCIETAWVSARNDVAGVVGFIGLKDGDSFIDELWINQRTVGGDADDSFCSECLSGLVVAV